MVCVYIILARELDFYTPFIESGTERVEVRPRLGRGTEATFAAEPLPKVPEQVEGGLGSRPRQLGADYRPFRRRTKP